MASDTNHSKDQFIYPLKRYRGDFTPENIAFDANLQEFAQRVTLICGLENGGKIDPNDAYHQIKALWKELAQSKKNLLDTPPPPPPDLPDVE